MSLLRVLTATMICAANAIAAGPTDFGPGTQVGRVSGLPELPHSLRKSYAEFRRGMSYFGAYAVHFEEEVFFWVRDFHSAGRARAAALEGCKQLSEQQGCVIYAVSIPETLPIDQSQADGLGRLASDAFKTVYQENRQPGSYAAFAISGASHYGYANADASAADARDTALAYCQRGVAGDLASIGPRGREFVRNRKWEACRVVDVTFTPKD